MQVHDRTHLYIVIFLLLKLTLVGQDFLLGHLQVNLLAELGQFNLVEAHFFAFFYSFYLVVNYVGS